MKIHIGEKPYSCSHCNKDFTMKSSLIIHARAHTGEKYYSSSNCTRLFKNTIILQIIREPIPERRLIVVVTVISL